MSTAGRVGAQVPPEQDEQPPPEREKIPAWAFRVKKMTARHKNKIKLFIFKFSKLKVGRRGKFLVAWNGYCPNSECPVGSNGAALAFRKEPSAVVAPIGPP